MSIFSALPRSDSCPCPYPPHGGEGIKRQGVGGLLIAREQLRAENLDLPPGLGFRQQPLVALPDKPFRMRVLDQRVHPAPHVLDGAQVGEVRPLHARDGRFLGGQHLLAVLGVVFSLAPGFEETEMVEEFAEGSSDYSFLGQFLRLRVIVREVHGAKHADALPQL